LLRKLRHRPPAETGDCNADGVRCSCINWLEVEPKMTLSAVSPLWRPDCACWVWEFRIPSRPWIDVARSRGRFRRRSRTRRERCSGEAPDAARMFGGCGCECEWLWIFQQRCWPSAVMCGLSASSVFKVQYYYVVFDIEYHKKRLSTRTGLTSATLWGAER